MPYVSKFLLCFLFFTYLLAMTSVAYQFGFVAFLLAAFSILVVAFVSSVLALQFD